MSKPVELEREEIEKQKEREKKWERKKRPLTVPQDTRLMPKMISLTGLTGKEFLLAKRKMATPKFLSIKHSKN
ncbi:jg14985 [Pararge aegeria aegeria]|uniref:Jg14985 protein n=1 Tax=Pararge aegeria aegeria TaxID=348720 RepID=A0A8S4R013_9NEOP|nr:jg14985 [Pararge aegeria aegeria]